MSSILNLWADWLFGNTRVRLRCSGVWIEGKFTPIEFILSYSHRDRYAALEDPIQIECSYQLSSISGDDKSVTEGPPIGFIIDPNLKMLLSASKSPLPTVKFTDEEIVVDIVSKSQTTEDSIRIDRVTGGYRRTVGEKGGGSGVQGLGKCVPVAPGKKF